jgi:hypothetical protein
MATLNTTQNLGPSITTTDATVTTLADFQTRPGRAYLVEAKVVAVDVPLAQAASYILAGTFITDAAGVLAQVGSTTSIHSTETDTNWACTLEASGTTIRLRATGEAAKVVNWRANVDIIKVGIGPQAS